MSLVKLVQLFFSLLRRNARCSDEAKTELTQIEFPLIQSTTTTSWTKQNISFFANQEELDRLKLPPTTRKDKKPDEEKEQRYQDFLETPDYDPSKDPQMVRLAKLYKSRKFDL